MRILVVCAAGYTYGKESITFSLVQGLRKRGHELIVLTSTWSNGEFERSLREFSIPNQKLPLGFISKTFTRSAIWMTLDQLRRVPTLWYGYRKSVRSFQPDVVIHSTFHHVCLLWPFLGKGINIFHVHDAFPQTTFYRRIFKIVNQRISMFVGVSNFTARRLIDLGIPNQKVTTVLNGVRVTGAITGNSKPAGLRQDNNLGKQKDPMRIGIVGQVAEPKGHEDLIDALTILEGKCHPFLCRVFGDGSPEFMAKLKSKIERHGFTDKVQWMGFVSDRDSIYDQIDVCVVPSRFAEPFGLVAVEAASYGLPVVATRRGGLGELIIDGQTGYMVDPESPAQIAERLCEILASSDRRKQMGQTARSHVLKSFSIDSMTDGIEAILRSLIEKRILQQRTGC